MNKEELNEKLYKVINQNNQSINGGKFDWTNHLPKNNKPGKWTPKIKNTVICERGYHLTKHWNMWIEKETDQVFECEAKNIKEWENDKCVCEQVRLVKQVNLNFKDKKMNTGYWNTGNSNTGDRNTGDRNTGNWNTGNSNTGCFNTKEPEYYLSLIHI